ncbi:DUF1990 family protein, partial [Streptomyces sp. NPDC046716]|uniref:DUF1990 family protein n=1 Tax=Streptomyces sp. NPDC046716 TaxID=3157093 RepID=UPI0033F78AF7
GFLLGSVPGFVVWGVVGFVVELDDDGSVWFRVRAFSRPGRWFVRVGGPVARRVQLWVTRRYLRAVVRACSDAP